MQLSLDHVQVFPDGELNVQAAASRDTSPSFARPSVRPTQQRARHMQEAAKLQSPSRSVSVKAVSCGMFGKLADGLYIHMKSSSQATGSFQCTSCLTQIVTWTCVKVWVCKGYHLQCKLDVTPKCLPARMQTQYRALKMTENVMQRQFASIGRVGSTLVQH